MKKHVSTLLSVIIGVSFLLTACGSSSPQSDSVSSGESLSGTISVSGAFALYPMMTVWAEAFTKIHPDVQFDVQGGGAGKGMTDTIAGAVDIGMSPRSITPEEEEQGIFWVSVTKDAVFPIISAENPVADQIMSRSISQEVFNKTYITGEITTWGEVIGDPSITDEIHVSPAQMSPGRQNNGQSILAAKLRKTYWESASGVLDLGSRPGGHPPQDGISRGPARDPRHEAI